MTYIFGGGKEHVDQDTDKRRVETVLRWQRRNLGVCERQGRKSVTSKFEPCSEMKRTTHSLRHDDDTNSQSSDQISHCPRQVVMEQPLHKETSSQLKSNVPQLWSTHLSERKHPLHVVLRLRAQRLARSREERSRRDGISHFLLVPDGVEDPS